MIINNKKSDKELTRFEFDVEGYLKEGGSSEFGSYTLDENMVYTTLDYFNERVLEEYPTLKNKWQKGFQLPHSSDYEQKFYVTIKVVDADIVE